MQPNMRQTYLNWPDRGDQGDRVKVVNDGIVVNGVGFERIIQRLKCPVFLSD